MKSLVSIIIPCYNEEATISLLLTGLLEQTYALERLEVVIADGLSTDQTRARIAAFQTAHPELAVQVVDNPKKNIPAALNAAMRAARGEIFVRLDAHSIPSPDYVARCVEALETEKGENVGGVWQIRPGADTWLAKSIAAAAAHPFGVGDAQYRYTTRAAEVDTVPFGAFRRSLVDRIGGFDETLLTNEDYEFNVRIRQSGGKVWLDPAIRSAYFARSTPGELARQYWRYGYWKARMLRRYPRTLRWRQGLPPLFVISLAVLLLLAPWTWLAQAALLAELALYALVIFTAGMQVALRQHAAFYFVGVPLAIAVMHFCWGSGFLWSLVKSDAYETCL
ncbi:MAG TPA: glycosyltransferase family 2 protein [Anaerolineaceae bacterium]|nr:glycosyltransferase family 2 protein [Anaerolineaceae bacterium]HPN53026.1 glycosyltransferase family 2 protein [Anaerolineaceae bacterium]